MSTSRYDRALKWMLGIAGFFLILLVVSLLRPTEREPWQRIGDGPRVGVVEIEGIILDGERVIRQLDQFSRRKDIEAILVRIDSPGGTVAASQEIYAKVRKVAQEGSKPVIASLGTVAASGGYYIAVAADTIVSSPGSTTGSIGVVLDYPVAAGLLDKIGLQMEVIKSGALKDAGSPFRPPTESDRRSFQRVIDDLHAQFTEVVAAERDLPLKRVQELATGEVFTGRQALDLELVDVLGGFEEALSLAAALTGSTKRPVIVRPVEQRRISILEFLLGDGSRLTWFPQLLPQYLMR
ncbi:MAG: signal peptide peptidase SppA [Fidelibacterota bacterium]|nr:MAG: signal peptide peptidase SppA [Candidatus Neomarinimicrobiota bacterium]